MKRLFVLIFVLFMGCHVSAQGYIRINYAGYLPQSKKVAVYILADTSVKAVQNAAQHSAPVRLAEAQFDAVKFADINSAGNSRSQSGFLIQTTDASDTTDNRFFVFNATTDSLVFIGNAKKCDPSKWALKEAYRLDFSKLELSGGYYIIFKAIKSPNFKIDADSYDGLADFLLYYMRQQQCGYNPFVDTLCHQKDAYIVDHPTRNGEMIDVRGGWHDASDYLQYQTTSATAIYDMMFAYNNIEDKSVFKDKFDAMGKAGANGIPDILDQAKWGLDWLNKMNPEDKVMFNQIGDDRDHIGFKPPQYDKADYGWGPGNGRPVYFLTGKPQGLGKYGKNRTTGVASTAGKFASSFSLGAQTFKKIDPKFSKLIQKKADQAYSYAKEFPGNTQTACYVSRYFYEEDTWVDDVELAAATIFSASKIPTLEKEADYYGQLEPVSPWMELGRGRHYQYYPFINLGHYLLATEGDTETSAKYKEFMREGLEDLRNRAGNEPFMNGVPYLWCSNNLVSAAVTQAELYRKCTGDTTYSEMEAALRDWLLGCNPWGTSMIIGYPRGGIYPTQPHSAFTVEHREISGGLVDGPVYYGIFKSRAGMGMRKPDQTPDVNKGAAVYHNDIGDYATNEPTMDGTAGLTYFFASLEQEGNRQKNLGSGADAKLVRDSEGAIVRIDTAAKNIYLIFSADSMFNGGEKIVETLKKEKIHASFFFTGNSLRMPEHKEIIENIISMGNYVGGHSDKHVLYAPWGKRDSLIVTRDSIVKDIRQNAAELAKFGIAQKDSKWFLSPYEYYNNETVNILERAGYKTINYTPGTSTPADYTIPSMKEYKTAQYLIDKLFSYENKNTLNGAIILIHPGIEATRPEGQRLYNRLREIVDYLKGKGYSFKSFKDLQ